MIFIPLAVKGQVAYFALTGAILAMYVIRRCGQKVQRMEQMLIWVQDI